MHIFIPYFYSSYHVFLLFCFNSKSDKKKSSKGSKNFSLHNTSPLAYNPSFLSPITPTFLEQKRHKKNSTNLKGKLHFCPHLSSQITNPPNLILPYI
jgi:hypothetical protein